MEAYVPAEAKSTSSGAKDNGELLRVAVTFKRPDNEEGPTKFAARMSTETVNSFVPEPRKTDLAIAELAKRGFVLTGRGTLSASMRCTKATFEKMFKTKLERMSVPGGQAAQMDSVLYPPNGAPWEPEPAITELLDDVYIQWPHIYMGKKPGVPKKKTALTPATMAGSTAAPPPIDYFHLTAPGDVARLLNAGRAHLEGITGKGIRVTMIDSGFAHEHPFFTANGYTSSVVLAPGAANRQLDGNGHGTGESANIFAVAPGVTFIGVKLDNENTPGSSASIHEGLLEALKHDPHVVSISLGYDLRAAGDGPEPKLPVGLTALEAEIQAAVKRGVIIVFSAGNGHYSFPGQMPDIISAGGVYVAENGDMRASDYASAFMSEIYSGRSVPDFCGLVGLLPHANYIALPVQEKSKIDRTGAAYDGTRADDGWGVFSGTSAAAPQIAGVCALLLHANPKLTPSEVKAVLRRTSRDVVEGNANPASDPSGVGLTAGGGEDGATGAGLVDAYAAVQQVRS